ncbi:MAG: glycosyltransferase [Synechococcaceae cyanobacterium]|nr:glycosyltransferase [Synechococcaceae cyanobacterium]
MTALTEAGPVPPLTRPALSVILIAFDGGSALASVLRALQAQTVQPLLELVLVVAGGQPMQLEPAWIAGFHGVQLLERPALEAVGTAYACGVRAAHADVVAFSEDHCLPEPGWAEALLAAHHPAVAAVGPSLRNANPGNAVSWADMLIGYGPWLAPVPGGAVSFLPGHNSSYRRSILLAYGETLAAFLDQETLLHWDLRRRGYRLLLQASAVVAHTNFGTLHPWLPVQFRCGRRFAAARASLNRWSRPQRWLYGLAAPLIPPLRLWRTLAAHRLRSPQLRPLPRGTWLLTALGLGVDALGQALGYWAGPGRSAAGLMQAEADRLRWLGSSRNPAVGVEPDHPC